MTQAGVECRFVKHTGIILATALAAAAVAWSRPSAQQVSVFRAGIELVNLGVTVADKKGSLVADLKAGDFEIYEDGKKQTIRYFAAGDPVDRDLRGPEMHLGLLLDVSESMGDEIKFTKTASIKFLNTLVDAVDITMVDFDTQVRVARYGQDEFARLIERIRQQKASGWTALYDAIGVYLDGAAGQEGRKIMLLYTDGGDNRSAIRFNELLDLLKASDVTVYAIGELEAVYDRVLAAIRAQFTIGYLSTNDKADGAWRKVEIKVTRKDDYRTRSRKGYFAPYKSAADKPKP
jgi:Ca-activated chloride channel family protein